MKSLIRPPIHSYVRGAPVLSAHCSLLVFAIAHSLGVRLNNPNRPKPVTPPVAMDGVEGEGEGGRGTDRESG